MNKTGESLDDHAITHAMLIAKALAAPLTLLSGGGSGASTYRVHGLSEPCVLKIIEDESADHIRTRGYREIHFYTELAVHLPLHTPRVLASLLQESGDCALLIAAYESLPPATALRAEDFDEIAIQLARFHAVYWNRTELLAHLAWLAKPTARDLTDDARHARETWLALAQRPQFRELLTASTLRAIEAALVGVQTKPEYGPDTALTLCHGDCHLDNLMRDQAGRLIWADWQEVRIGYGPSDLTFLMQRAEANGATIAHARVVAVYCKALQEAGIDGVNERAIMSAMNESARRTRLLYWPDYMSEATSERMAHHLTRIFSA